MARLDTTWDSLWPALAFLLTGVPLAALLDQLGFFAACAALVARRPDSTSVLGLWVLAALTTVVLNLDTTVVLLTPLSLRLARRADTDPLPLVALPLLLAGLASSVLPVSNLTTLIAAEHFSLTAGDVLAHLALPSLAAVTVGWLVYRRRNPTRLELGSGPPPDRRALAVGGSVVAAVLVGFVVGPLIGIDAWVVALVADVVLVAVTRTLPWRAVPVATALFVAALATIVTVVVPADALTTLLSRQTPVALAAITVLAAGAANVVNNLPALVVALDGTHRMSWGMWAWLLGVNVGAVLLPIGALANLLWLRILRAEGISVGLRRYVSITAPVVLPAFAAAIGILVLERAVGV